MIAYQLRLDSDTKQRAKKVAQEKGVSENTLYHQAIEEFLMRHEANDFYQKLLNRVVSPGQQKKLLNKIKNNKAPVLYPEDALE